MYLPFSFGLDAQMFFLHFFLILFFSLMVKCLLLIPTFPVSVSPRNPDLYCCHHQCQLWSLKHLSFICSFVPTFQFLLTLIAPLCSKNSEQTNKRLVSHGELPPTPFMQWIWRMRWWYNWNTCELLQRKKNGTTILKNILIFLANLKIQISFVSAVSFPDIHSRSR